MRAVDLREKSVEDLRELEKSLSRDVFQNRLKNFTNRLDDTSAIRKSKRDLARVITVLRERTVVGAKPAAAHAEAVPAPRAQAPTVPEVKVATAEAKPPKKATAKKAAASAGEAPAAPKKTTAKKGTKSEAK